jgi:prepilin-type N-terminal cleavage/methylation domain-containing protein
MRCRRHPAFTLIEMLVVIAIILLVSIVALPVVYSALSGRQVDDAARIFTGMLAGIRDTAIRYNAPRGLRLLPDPTMTLPALGDTSQGTLQLVYNRMVQIEPAGDYSEGRINIGPMYPTGTPLGAGGFPPFYPIPGNFPNSRYPFPDATTGNPYVLMVEEAPFSGGFAWDTSSGFGSPNPPTSWYWNIRVGDKLKINDTGRTYTVVGPLTISPWGTGPNQGNLELFVNVGPPGATSPLTRTYYTATSNPPPGGITFSPLYTNMHPEFLFLVNGDDDDKDGYVDEGWDGYNQNPLVPGVPPALADTAYDDPSEWEQEKWAGSQATNSLTDSGSGASPSPLWLASNWQTGTHDTKYTIQRRAVPSQGAREVSLPAGVVIDATSWNSNQERSRIAPAIQFGSLFADIMINPSGQFLPTAMYSSPTAKGAEPFMHFWLSNREDVYPRTQPGTQGPTRRHPRKSTNCP